MTMREEVRIAVSNVALVTTPGRISYRNTLIEGNLDLLIQHLVPFSLISYIGRLESRISQIINRNISTCSELLATSNPFYGKNNLAEWIFIIKDLTQMETIQGLTTNDYLGKKLQPCKIVRRGSKLIRKRTFALLQPPNCG